MLMGRSRQQSSQQLRQKAPASHCKSKSEILITKALCGLQSLELVARVTQVSYVKSKETAKSSMYSDQRLQMRLYERLCESVATRAIQEYSAPFRILIHNLMMRFKTIVFCFISSHWCASVRVLSIQNLNTRFRTRGKDEK